MVLKGRETAKLATAEGVAELQQIWDDIRAWTQSRIATYVREEAGDAYTKEEREMGVENARTGLKRDVEEDDDGEDEDEDDEEGDDDAEVAGNESKQVVTGPEPETLLFFMARADFEVPRNVEYERKGMVKKGFEGVNVPPERMVQ